MGGLKSEKASFAAVPFERSPASWLQKRLPLKSPATSVEMQATVVFS